MKLFKLISTTMIFLASVNAYASRGGVELYAGEKFVCSTAYNYATVPLPQEYMIPLERTLDQPKYKNKVFSAPVLTSQTSITGLYVTACVAVNDK